VITSLLHSYGYLAIIVLVAVECVGVPLPGESTLIAAALYAGSTHRLNVVAIAAVAAAAAVAGDNIGYGLGHVAGPRLLHRYRRFLHLTAGRLAVGRYVFRRHGGNVVFFGRFVGVLRTYAAFLAGVNRMPWGRFVAFNAAGGVLWAGVYSFGAFGLGAAATGVGSIITVVGVAVAAVAVLAAMVIGRRFYTRLEQRALAAEALSAATVGAP
jgi:membrane protein DedA with SNARE-associated domain